MERLQNILARRGVASRRHAATLIQEGVISVNSEIITEPGFRVDETTAKITVRGKPIRLDEEKKRTFIFYKPLNVVSSTDGQGARTICDYFSRYRERLVPVGRLDKDSEGVILVSNDGSLINHLTHPRFEHEKIYDVRVEGFYNERILQKLRSPMTLDDGYTIRPVKVEFLRRKNADTVELRFFLGEGRNRQIRKMCENTGLYVVALRRISFAGLTIGSLKPGDFRELETAEIEKLKK